MFDSIDFESVTIGSRRSSANEQVTITHLTKKNGTQEHIYRLSRDTLDKLGLVYGDRVDILYSKDQSVCRIQKVEKGGLKLGQQVKDNENSAALVRVVFRPDTHPDLLSKAKNIRNPERDKCKYGFKDNRIEYKEGCLTFELKLVD
ncbi:hypothetical protein [Vibrio cholerae]|uniref:Uncharacterized protein n=1 Tax=Vibrio cholerae TaxID=666 RepID=A0A655TEE7_VIBCL|nr:hypothetical protein [Vibrio cholerae]AFC58305.1 hypothetical protein O3Y_07135 [Vibrio cholerae IEC224]AVL22687.1 hypothetical protein VCA1552_01264 [Vibrio cholerae]AWB74008.1 hypothetical protein A1552VC_01266 [Vibrio cholerae]CAB1239326.1 Uncharacterised protein [Vibrio cholerae]CRZ44111.1 Uncharacterised protein [Vibrio cholerae]